jgi:Zinc knuckle
MHSKTKETIDHPIRYAQKVKNNCMILGSNIWNQTKYDSERKPQFFKDVAGDSKSKEAKRTFQTTSLCYLCNKKGHIVRDCPFNKFNVYNKKENTKSIETITYASEFFSSDDKEKETMEDEEISTVKMIRHKRETNKKI